MITDCHLNFFPALFGLIVPTFYTSNHYMLLNIYIPSTICCVFLLSML
nr:MAG TPA: hypothetical protein [Caudoviricetes sp.]